MAEKNEYDDDVLKVIITCNKHEEVAENDKQYTKNITYNSRFD